MGSLYTLPSEVIYHIFSLLSPRDVIRLRVLSKRFYNLTYDTTIWGTLYTNTRLPRPAGPFPSQSLQFLERTLVRSERLTRSWTTQPMEDISTIRMPGLLSKLPKMIFGKWLLLCESSIKFVVYNLDSGTVSHSNYQLLWESASPIFSWDACPVVTTNGLLIYVVFRVATMSVPWKLLEFRVDGDSLHHTLALDVPTTRFGESVCLDGGNSPFLHIAGQRSIFDAKTRSFYEFPELESTLVNVIPWVTLLTKTHIISVSHHVDRTVSPVMFSTLLQAFILPDPHVVHNGRSALRLSHEAVMPGRLRIFDLVRNSIVDAVSGTTIIRFLHQFFDGDNLTFSCIDLTLPNHSIMDTVVPMNIGIHEFAHVNRRWFSLYTDRTRYIEFSDDGHVRGFWRFFVPRVTSGSTQSSCPVMRFTIDASQDRCVAVLGRITAPQWKQVADPPQARNILFDGVRGMLCYDKRWYTRGVDDDEPAIVINIK